MRSRRQQRAADRKDLRRIVRQGVTPGDLAQMTGVSEGRWLDWLRGDKPMPPRLLDAVQVALAGLIEGDHEQQIERATDIRRAQRDPNILATLIPSDAPAREKLRSRVESGQAKKGWLGATSTRPLNETERVHMLQELARPHEPSASQ